MVGPFVGTYDEYSRVDRKWVVSSTLRYKKAIYRGEIVEGYFVLEDGRILSDKQSRGRELRELSWHLRGNGDAMYPSVNLYLRRYSPTSMSVHRLVAETYVPKLDKPLGVPSEDWDITPESVKLVWSKIATEMCVNHIDHDKENFHPSNLEWVTARENVEKRDQFYSAKKAA
jgi:hypothetical protein